MKSIVKRCYRKKYKKSDIPKNELNAEHLKNCLESMDAVKKCMEFYKEK